MKTKPVTLVMFIVKRGNLPQLATFDREGEWSRSYRPTESSTKRLGQVIGDLVIENDWSIHLNAGGWIAYPTGGQK